MRVSSTEKMIAVRRVLPAMMTFWGIIMFSGLLFQTTASAQNCTCPGNLLVNPSFESSSFSTDWSTETNDPNPIVFGEDNPYAVCGSWYGYHRAGSASAAYYATVYQEKPATAGTLYSFGAYGGTHDPVNQDQQFKLQFYNASHTLLGNAQSVQVDADVDVAPFTLAYYTLSATAPAGTAFVRVSAFTQGDFVSENMVFKYDAMCLTASAAPSCTIALGSPTTTICASAPANTYAVSGNVTFSNAPATGTLTVTVQGGGSQVFSAPFTSPQSYMINSLIADGINRTITANFSASSCPATTTFTAPNSTASTPNFPLNSVLGNVNYDGAQSTGTFIFNLFIPAGGGSPQSWTPEAFDVDFTPQGITNYPSFCVEWAEDFDPNSNYQNYTIIPLENISRGQAGDPASSSVHIPVGGIGLVRAGMIRYLFDQYYQGTTMSVWTATEAAAFQLALWEVTHEVYTSNNSFSITTASANGFYTTMSDPAVTLGQSYVAAINTLNWSDAQWMSYESTTWHVIPLENNPNTGVGFQDIVTAVPKLPVACTPSCALTPTPLTITDIAFGPGSAPMPENVTLNAGVNVLTESNVAGFHSNVTTEGAMYTFCTEITQPLLPLQNPYTHEYNNASSGFTPAVALRIARVIQASGFNASTGFGAGNNTIANFVALQLSVWNALYDTDYSVSAGSFQSLTNNNNAVAIANAWLATAQTITAPTVVVHNLHNATGQDLVLARNVPSTITAAITQPGCSGAGAPNNGVLTLSGFTNQRYRYSAGLYFNSAAAIPAAITAIPAGGVIANNLANSNQNYTVRIYDASDDNCYVDQTVSTTASCCFNVTSTTPLCHGNGTPETGSDDYITFSVNVKNPLENAQHFTITGTQNGNPVTITLSDGSAANAVNCGLNTALRTPTGTAGHGAITLTITDNYFGCTTTTTIADPGSCAVTCTPGTPSTVTYSYTTQVDITELNALPVTLPQFDQMGGSRTLTSVKLDYTLGVMNTGIFENRAANPQTFKTTFSTDMSLDLNGNAIAQPTLTATMPLTTIAAGILVPAQGAWPGDVTPAPPAPQVPSTIAGMEPWLSDEKLIFMKDPRTDPRYVTNATGDPTTDDDMYYFAAQQPVSSGSVTYNTAGTIAPFIGSGIVPLTATTLSGYTLSGGGGNISSIIRTRAFASATVTYTYECAAPCSMSSLTAVLGACDPATNTYTLTGQLTFSNPPTDGELTIRVPGGDSRRFPPPYTSPINYTLGPLNSDMAANMVTASFSTDPACAISTNFTAPMMCLSTAPACGAGQIEGFEVYTDTKPLSTTNFTHNFTGIPKFNTMGGTRTLKKVLVSFQQTMRTAGVLESTDAAPSTLYLETMGTASLKLAGNPFATVDYDFVGASINVTAGVAVPAQGAWPGDVVGSTILAMSTLINNNLNAGTDPTTDPGWVTTLTGDPTDDDDIAYFPPHLEDTTGNFVVTAPAQLADFTGTGAVALSYMASANSFGSGSGNMFTMIRTKAGATVYVKYIYCETTCTAPSLTTTQTNVGCNGALTGAIDLTVTGGSPTPFTYAWSNMANTEDISGLAAGTYTVTVTTASGGCSATTSVTITQPASALSVTAAPTNSTSCAVPNGAINITATGGTGAYNYDWADIAGTNNVEDRTGLGAGTYTVTVTDANGCTTSTSTVITAPNSPSLNAVPTNILCFGASTGAINITASGGTGAYTYDWADIAGTNNLEDRTGLAAGMYTVTVTDAASCTVSASYTLTQPATAVAVVVTTQTNILCFGASTGAINITASGGTGAYNYDWADVAGTNNSEDRTSLAVGTYTVTVTDANGCTATVSATLTQPATAVSVTSTQTNIACFGGATGAINITAAGGTGAYNYDWQDIAGTNNAEDRMGLAVGTYTVTVTDANGCTTSTSVVLTQPAAAVSVTGIVTNSTSCTAPNGSINITAVGGTSPYTYDWADIAGTNNVEDRTGLGAGTYNVTVTDLNGCTATNTFTVGAPPSPTFSANVVTDVLCFGQSTGAINVTLTGGVAPYTYDWADLAGTNNGEDRTNIPAGTYTVTATDNVGCTASTSATVTQPAAALSITLTGITTTDCINGTIDITVSGGTSGYTYDWSNDGPETPDNDPQDLVINAPGTYTVTVTDANGCTSTLSATYTGCDKGDLPDPSYPTLNANNGPSHVIVTGIKIGATVDAEGDGQPNGTATGDGADEDGFIPANVMFVAGQTVNVTIPVMNMNAAAKMTIYIDWNKDGDLVDANEMFSAVVALNATTVTIPIAVPVDAVLNMDLGMRIRLTTSATMSPTGFAPDGEVEDYLIQVMGFDYGDLSDSGAGTGTGNYNTLSSDNGPSHKIISTLKLGASVDADVNGQQSTLADGDDSTTAPGTDDENGVTLPMFVTGTASNVDFTLMNMTGGNAKLTLFIDWNKDGDFLDAGEMYSTTVANNATTASISVTPPLTAVLNMNLGVRVRLSTDATASMLPTGPAPDGEVEDYVTQVMGFDYGDLYDPSAGTGTAPSGTPANYNTLNADNGAKHKIVTDASGNVTLKIGASVDDEADGQPVADAGKTTGGDDNTESPDDEDGLNYATLPLFIVTQTTNLSIPVMNMTGSDAKLVVYIDFNKDGDFLDAGEMFSTTVVNNAVTANVAILVPANAVVGQDLGLRIRLAAATEPMVPTGAANSGEVEDYVIQVIGYDYGDLPDTYNTNGNDNPPNHIVSNDLKLGASVDAELDGAPEAMAGLMTGGDDNTPGLVTFGTSTPAGDDENGVTFLTPMVPGSQACISVTAMNMNPTAAVLQMWIDFNGDGDMLDAGEAVTTGSFNGAGGGAVVPATVGLTNAQLCFNVPVGATFATGGAAFVRFRLSPLGGLAPNTQTAPVPFGEIEDYKVQLGCVGNLVWEDRNFDGTQQTGEPGISGVTVGLTWFGADGVAGGAGINADVVYPTTLTDNNGKYYFCGLTDGPGATDNNFKVIFTSPNNMTPTRTNQGGNDVNDSDGAITGMDLSMTMETFAFTFPTPTTENSTGDNGATGFGNFGDAQVDETHDQGFAFLDYGDLPETGTGTTFTTMMINGGPVHVILPGFKLGSSVDGERDATTNATATGDDNTNTGSADDEDGVTFTSPLIPGNNATISVVSMNPTGANAVLQGWIDWNGNGLLDATEALAFTSSVIPTGNATTTFSFPVPAAATFNAGMVYARFRLSATGGLTPNGPDKYSATAMPQGEVEDYKLNVGKIGNLVWEDRDFDGVQDAPAGEPGINGVVVTLQWAGPDGLINGVGDVTYNSLTTGSGTFQQGEYYYCGLIPGTYKLIYTSPANSTPTRVNQGGNDVLDSDGSVTGMDMSMAMETFTIVNVTALPTAENGNGDNGTAPTGTFPDNQTDETHDQGFAFIDYGDLPETGTGTTFTTTMGNGGPIHVILPGFKLGAGVDAEQNGAPNANADGDDNTNTGVADDEDGVSFITPLIPGNNASISVVSMNPTGANAVLQGWIDWNGNGLLDATEALAFTSSVIPQGNATTTFTFPVPANATFNAGMVFARFRLSQTGGLGPNGPDKYGALPVPNGEVEDYKKNVMCVGNIVWEDYDFDGQQDPTEPGIGGVTVNLVWGGADGNTTTTADNVTYTTTTLSANTAPNIIGEYSFCGLIEGTYKIVAQTPADMTPTLSNTGSQVNGGYTDNDGIQTGTDLTMIMTDPFTVTLANITTQPTGENGLGDNAPNPLGTFPDNQANESYDFGFVVIDFGDLPDTYVTDDTPDNSGAQHVVQPQKFLGTCVDGERNATIDPNGTAGTWASGDDFTGSTRTQGTCAGGSDDENGVQFITPLVPGYQACVRITYTSLDVPGLVRTGNTYLSAWLDYNGNNQFDAGEQAVTDLPLQTGSNVIRDVCFDVPNTARFNGGAVRARFRLHCQPGLGSSGLAIGGEVEDYYIPVSKAGNYVWFDNDLKGDQMTATTPKVFQQETGINDADLVLVWGGLDGNLATLADNRVYRKLTGTGNQGENQNGIYYFCGLIEGQYRVVPRKYAGVLTNAGIDSLVLANPTLAVPVRKILTVVNNTGADDYKDSDGSPSTTFAVPNLLASPTATLGTLNENSLGDLPTVFGYPDRLTNLGLDFGYVQEPNIELNQKIAGVEKGSQCGQFKVIVDLCIQNSGGYENGYVMAVPLANIQAQIPLQQQLGAAFIMTMGAPQVINSTWECGTAANPQQIPTVNANFNGASDVNLFNGTSGLIWPGEKIVVRYVFEVKPSNIPEPASLNLQFQASGSGKAVNYQGQPILDYFNGGAQFMAMDLSNNDLVFNGTYNDPDVANTIGDCWKTTQSMAANDLVYVSIDANCQVLVTDEMILEGEDEDCTNNAFCLGGYYTVKIKTQQGLPVPNPVPATYFGQTLIVEVENVVSCNKTWGQIKFEDKLAPEIQCSDIHLSCPITTYDPNYLQNTLHITDAYPTVTDCSPYTVTYVDTWHDVLCNQGFNGVNDLSAYVVRKWTAKDAWNNTSTCVQYIYFHRIHVGDVDFPADYVINCGANINTDPSVTGTPYYTDFGINWNLFPDPGFCELQAAYTDQILPVCDGTYKILRTWTLVDWCLPTTPYPPTQNPQYYIQLIKVLDSQGPAMTCPANLTVSTDPYNCCATTNLPDITIEDNCSRINNISAMVTTFDPYTGDQTGMYTVDGALTTFPGNNYWDLDTLGNWGWTPCLPVGRHTVVYTAEDDCGNTSTCSFRLTVADYQPPVAACDQYTVVAIGTDDVSDCYTPANGCDGAGVTWVKAKTFDDGSTDNCNGLHFTIRRMDPYSDCINNLEDCEKPNATEERDSIKFYCCEVGTTQTVILRVYQVDQDGAIMNGQDGTPLFNECMVNVEVQDKIKPVCQPPANVTVACENFDASLWVYGKATVYDNCCLDTTKVYQGQCGLSHSANYNLFDTVCNKGTITRTFKAYDCHGLTSQCTQRVVVQYNQDYYVKFPNDVIVTVCDGTGNYGEPSFFGEDCELLGVSYEDQVFTVVPDACFKIERVWTIINWCTYNPNLPCIEVPNPNPNAISNNPANLPGPIVSRAGTLAPWAPTVVKINPTDATATNYSTFWNANANCYRYKQIIKVIDTQDPTIENCPASPVEVCDITPNDAQLWNTNDWWDNLIGQHDLCEGPTDLTITATDACSAANINFRYLLFLDLDNDGTMETVINSVNTGIAGLGWNAVPFNNYQSPNYTGGTLRSFDGRAVPANQKYGFAIQTTTSGTKKTASVRWNTQQSQNNFVIPELPYGTHKIKWFVEDGCGNESICEYTFIVKDCKKPTVVCLNGLSVNIMPTQMIQLWASDFLKYTEDNCTPANQLKIAIRKSGTGTGFPVDGNGNPITNVTFTCDELGTQLVELWSIDKAGNADFCETYVIVQDNNGFCPNQNAAKVAGALATEAVNGLEEGAVEIAGSSNAVPSFNFTTMSSNTGAYNFNAIPLASNSTVTPAKDDNPLNGVSTYDLVLISKHILGIEPLNSPYKMIAADANKSGSITTFDIVELRKLILGIYSELPTNTSWRFVDKSFAFPNAANPFQTQFPETRLIQNLLTDKVEEDFVSVKVGDVNGTAIANSLMSTDDRTAGTLLFDVNDRAVRAGETFTVALTPAQASQGYQFTLNTNGLEVMDVAGLKGENYAVFAGATTFSVDGDQAQSVVTLTLKATKAGKLSEMLSISSRITKAEAYITASAGATAVKHDVAFRFNNGGVQTISGVGFELYQNQPNPFVNKTFIGFHLPLPAEARSAQEGGLTTATLTIYDETGRLIHTQKGNFAKGYNSFTIEKALVNTTGMLYYKVETATDSGVKQMIQSK